MKLGMKVKGLFSINICKISNLLILRTGKIAPNSPVLNLIFNYQTKRNNSRNFKNISSTSLYCTKPP